MKSLAEIVENLDRQVTERLIVQIRPLIAGRPPEVQVGVLADLMAGCLAAQPEDRRNMIFDAWLAQLPALVELYEFFEIKKQREATKPSVVPLPNLKKRASPRRPGLTINDFAAEKG